MAQNGAHASKLVVAGTEYRVRRTFEKIVMIEERFGEIGAFITSCERDRLKARDLADLYAILLSGEDVAVSPAEIGTHIATVGTLTAFRPALNILGALFLGEETFMAALTRRTEGNGASPPKGAGESIGANS